MTSAGIIFSFYFLQAKTEVSSSGNVLKIAEDCSKMKFLIDSWFPPDGGRSCTVQKIATFIEINLSDTKRLYHG